jgi:hypothetical protein
MLKVPCMRVPTYTKLVDLFCKPIIPDGPKHQLFTLSSFWGGDGRAGFRANGLFV